MNNFKFNYNLNNIYIKIMVRSRKYRKGGNVKVSEIDMDSRKYNEYSTNTPYSKLKPDENISSNFSDNYISLSDTSNPNITSNVSIIATHQSRIRCMLSSILGEQVERFMNGAVLRLEISPENINIQLLYPGELDEVKPDVKYYTNNIIGNEKNYTPVLFETINTSYGNKFDTQGETYIFFLIRHGQGTHNVLKGFAKKTASISGQRDTRLTSAGFLQAENTGRFLANNQEFLSAKSLFASDLFRTIETLVTILETADTGGKITDGVAGNEITVLPCAHELNYNKSGNCDGNAKQMMMGNENKSSNKQVNSYNGFQINWSYYSAFYNGSRMSPGSNRQRCRNTNFLQEAIKILNGTNNILTTRGGKVKKYSRKRKKNKKHTRKKKIKRRKGKKNKKSTKKRKTYKRKRK